MASNCDGWHRFWLNSRHYCRCATVLSSLGLHYWVDAPHWKPTLYLTEESVSKVFETCFFSKTNSEFTGQERHCASKGRLSFMHTWLKKAAGIGKLILGARPRPLLTDVQKVLGALDQWPLWSIFCSFSPFVFFFKWWFISSPRWFIFLYNFFLERLFVILLVLDLKRKKWGGKRVHHEYFHLKGCVDVIILHAWLQCHKEIERR